MPVTAEMPATSNEPLTPRLQQFQAEVEQLKVTGGRANPERTWMIGNSPKSDINPALAAGLRAVFVPHPRTWSLEHEDVPEEHPRLLRVGSITELTRYF